MGVLLLAYFIHLQFPGLYVQRGFVVFNLILFIDFIEY